MARRGGRRVEADGDGGGGGHQVRDWWSLVRCGVWRGEG
jgi:hypothetical protein